VSPRPFGVRYVEDGPVGILEVVVRFSRISPPNDEGLRMAQRLMNHFAVVAAHGGLSDTAVPPASSTLSLTAEEIGPEESRWKFEGVRVSPAVKVVIENLVEFIHRRVASVSQLDVIVSRNSGLARTGNALSRLRIQTPFRYVFEPQASEVVLDIEFLNEVEDSGVRDQFVRLWDSWLYVAAAGGFEDEDWAGPVRIFPDGEPESYADEITLFMDQVSVSDTAFDVLVNGFHKLHFVAAPLKLVHVY